jgi:hypothetical protein
VLRRWTSGNSTLVPLALVNGQILFGGDMTLGRIDPENASPVWNVSHQLSSDAVYRPRVAGQLVIAGGQHELGAWQFKEGRRRWLHQANIHVGTPFLTPERTYDGDANE